MKRIANLSLFIFIIISLSSCTVAVSLSEEDGESATPTDYKAWGNNISTNWKVDINKQNSKTYSHRKALLTWGIVSVGLGTVSGAVNSGLSDNDRENVTYGVSIASAVVGIIELIGSTKGDLKQYVIESRKAVKNWDLSPTKGYPEFKKLYDELERIQTDYNLPRRIDTDEP